VIFQHVVHSTKAGSRFPGPLRSPRKTSSQLTAHCLFRSLTWLNGILTNFAKTAQCIGCGRRLSTSMRMSSAVLSGTRVRFTSDFLCANEWKSGDRKSGDRRDVHQLLFVRESRDTRLALHDSGDFGPPKYSRKVFHNASTKLCDI
jgi:hypothetical protein